MVVLGWGLAELVPVLIGVMVMLIAGGFRIIANAISGLIGKVGVGFLSFDLGSAIASPLNGFGEWVMGHAFGAVNHIADWLWAHVWLIGSLATATTSVLQHLGDQIAHIVTTEIPDAADRVVSWARREIDRAAHDIGSSITGAERAAAHALDAASRAIYEKVAEAEHTIDHDVVSAVSHAVDQAEGHADRITHDLRTFVDHGLNTVAGDAARALDDTRRQLGSAISTLAGTVRTDIADAEALTRRDVQAARDAATSQVAEAEHLANKGIAAARAAATTAVAGAEKQAQSLVNLAEGQARALVKGAKEDATKQIAAAGGAALNTLEGALGGIYTDVTGKAIAAGGDLAGIEGLLAGAITASIAGVVTRVAALEACAVYSCEPGAHGYPAGNQIGNILKDLLGVAEFGAVFAALAEIIQNPVQAEHKYAGLVQGLYQQGDSLMDTLLSI